MLSRIMNDDQELNSKDHEEFLNELKMAVPIVVINQPRKIYEVERRIDEMLKQGAPYGQINKEIGKLRKYSF